MYNHLSIATSTILAKTRHYPSALREPRSLSHDSTVSSEESVSRGSRAQRKDYLH